MPIQIKAKIRHAFALYWRDHASEYGIDEHDKIFEVFMAGYGIGYFERGLEISTRTEARDESISG